MNEQNEGCINDKDLWGNRYQKIEHVRSELILLSFPSSY